MNADTVQPGNSPDSARASAWFVKRRAGHVVACFRAMVEHLEKCPKCPGAKFGALNSEYISFVMCDVGRACFAEWHQATQSFERLRNLVVLDGGAHGDH